MMEKSNEKFNSERHPAYYKDLNTYDSTLSKIADGTISSIAMESKEPRVQLKRITKERSGGYDWEITQRLLREHNAVFHPRTKEFILGCTSDDKPQPYHKKHLGGFPAVSYHRATNRVQKTGKFVVQPLGKEIRQLLKITPTDTAVLNVKLDGELNFKNTSQYKTVWNTRGQRRSKA